MVEYANAQGLSVSRIVAEIASGVNDTRPKLTKLLQDDSWGTLVVEHKDRLSRVGFTWFEVLLEQQGRRISVANRAQDSSEGVREDFEKLLKEHGLTGDDIL